MVADKALYDVLGVETNATQEQITKAAKKKALEHHPDRGGSHEMMQQINAAKAVLTDPKKREIYDQYGLEGLKSGMGEAGSGFSGFSGGLSDIFDLLNGGASRRRAAAEPQGADTKHALRISLEDLYSGSTKTVSINRDVVCTNCKGTGCHDSIKRECTSCKGQGIETVMYRMGPMIQQMQRKCSACNGAGDMINSKNRCKTCQGKKLLPQMKTLDVHIAPGSQNGETIKFTGEGNQIPNGNSGTVYVILQQQPHSTFERDGDNITMKLSINLAESLCGFQRPVTLLDGHKILINHPLGKPIVPNSYRCIKGHGMPNRRTHSHGDLIIHFDVKFPEENFIITDSQREQLEAILPPRSHVKLNSKERYEETEMMDYELPRKNSHQQRFGNGHHHHGADDDDDDGDDHGNGHNPGVQCATQ